ncbi:MAG: hypothetical protein JWM00_778 [Candidatus Saccharibacteria bacterium]|nr:hypothetical protein [Candidatus Saccharibacteria bacterium]
MLNFEWSPWIILVVVVYLVALLVVCATYEGLFNTLGYMIVTVLSTAVLITGLNIGSLLVTSGTSIPHATTRDTTALFGLESDAKYNLRLGSRFGGTSVDAAAASGIFYANASVSTQPASALSLGFAYGDQSYILEIPMSKVTFTQSETIEPGVVLHINDDITYGVDVKYRQACGGIFAWNLLLIRDCKSIVTGMSLSSDTQRRGLARIVTNNLDSASITLTSDMYDRILGTP